MSGYLLAVAASAAIPSAVIWAYAAAAAVLAIGIAMIAVRGDWDRARGLEKLLVFAPLFYVAPIAAFGTEHFTTVEAIASIVPRWMPWHRLWAYLVGACFIAAALSIASRIRPRLSAALLAFTFFSFVVLMDVPAWVRAPGNVFALTLALRELAFSGGALALVASLSDERRERTTRVVATIARSFIAVPVLVYSVVQFTHGDHVPGVPLKPLTPPYVIGHSMWTYMAAAVYAVTGTLLLVGKKTRAAAIWLGVTVLLLVIAVYAPIAFVERASLKGFNFIADTLMLGGAFLLLAAAMPRKRS